MDKLNQILRNFNTNGVNKNPDSFRPIKYFTNSEFLVGCALLIGAADCAGKGETLWKSSGRKKKEWKKHWLSFSPDVDFGKHMRAYRFRQFRTHVAKIWQDNPSRRHQDPWWQFSPAIRNFNSIRQNLILPCEVIVIDESMSAFRPQTTKTGGMHNISFIMRKPENLGTEFKSSVCAATGIMTYLELQSGRELMKESRYFSHLGATASCTLRIAEGVTDKTADKPSEIVLGDSWFGSVKAASALSEAGFESILQIKTNHALFPKKEIEGVLATAPGGTSMVLRGVHPVSGVELLAVGYKYNKKTVLSFVISANAGSTENSKKPYEMKWTDNVGNVNVRMVERPEVISFYFEHCNIVDVHNHFRQYCLKLEKKWITFDPYFRLFTTLVGINVVDTYYVAKYHNLLPQGRKLNIISPFKDCDGVNELSMQNFAGLLSTQLLYKAHNLQTNITLHEEDLLKVPPGLKYKEEGNKLDSEANRKRSVNNEKKRTSKEKHNPNHNAKNRIENYLLPSQDKVRKTSMTAFTHNITSYQPEFTVGDNSFKDESHMKLSSPDCSIGACNSNSSGIVSTHQDFSLGSNTTSDFITERMKRQRWREKAESEILQTMYDARGRKHSALKLKQQQSNGRKTKNKNYTTVRKCVVCGKKSRVKCLECDKVYCFPIRNKEAVHHSCFKQHIEEITKPKFVTTYNIDSDENTTM